jgi:hypothetical protein
MAKQATLYIRDLEHIHDLLEVQRRARLDAHAAVDKYAHLFNRIGQALRGENVKSGSMKQKKPPGRIP